MDVEKLDRKRPLRNIVEARTEQVKTISRPRSRVSAWGGSWIMGGGVRSRIQGRIQDLVLWGSGENRLWVGGLLQL